ncbi:hypothetical protein POM88_050105 [Heracleum sosnowskyi]|uniref:Branched-chain-amino-acid transaminase n=1 Tax=Heracleum sosnowskyi TaxID=360622 RepID=A0AAD8GZ32_9APIA|nr:hypothetical protein POM88_050105 [Heracleum sosnowskyi]
MSILPCKGHSSFITGLILLGFPSHIACLDVQSGALAQTFGSSTCGIHSALQNLLVSGAEKLTDSLLDVTRKQHFDKANVTVASKLFLALVNVILMDTVNDTVLANERWVPPPGKGSLYIRPLLMGSGSVLSLAPAPEFTFLIYVSPVGNYFKDGLSPIDLMVETETHRATPGGTGCVKTIGNYAAVLKAQSSAKAKGYSDVLYLDHSCAVFYLFHGAAGFKNHLD